MTAREMAVNASTSAGTVDYIPTEITFQRADGVRARNRGTTPDSDLKSLVANETSTLTVQIRNAGTAGSRFSFKVTFYEEVDGVPVPIGSTIFSDYIPAGFTQFTSIQHTFTSPGLKTIWAFIDSDEQIGELNETNNWYSTTIYVKEEEAAYDFTISGIVFDWDGNTPLPGATVRLRNTVSGYIDTTVTDGAGKYLLVLDRDFYNDNHPIELSASNPPDPAEDSTIISFYSEDLEVTNVDLYLFVFGVDLTFRPRLGHSVSFIREDGQYSNQPIAGRETIIRFWVVNRGTEGANGTFQITKNGTSSVQLIGDPLETLRWYGPQSVTQVDYVYTFTDPEVVDIDINIVDADGLEIYTVNNLARRTGITIKSKITNMPYDLTGTVYERAGFEDRFAADATVVITNTRTGYSFTTTTDDFGRFTFDLRDLPERYQEGDIIHVRAWKEGVGEGNRTFHAYSEDLGRHIIIVFASYDVRVSASDVRRTVAPGEWTGYQITIFNTGNLNDRFALSLEGEYADWGEFDLADPWIDIRAGSSAMVTLIVDVPEDYATARAGIVATITVVAVSNNGKGPRDSVDTSTTVEQVFEFSLDLDRTLDQGDPGDTIHYTITVTNTGNGRDTLLLGLSGTRIAWAELSPSILTLQPGVPYDVALTVSIPDLARFEDDARFRVTGLSTGGISESTPEIVTGVNEILGVELTVGSPTMYGDPGATVLYSITVHNRGNSQQQMVFTINGPGNGAISVEPTIDGFRSTVVTMSVTIAPQAKANVVYTNLVTASLRDHSTVQSNTISILTVVNEKPGDPVLEVIGTTERTIRPSTSVTFPIRVTNNANIDDTFSFTVENSHPDFFYSIPALAVSSGASGTVDLRITAPSNAVFGDRADLVIRAVSSRGRTSGPGTVTVNVTTYIYGVELSIAGSEKEKKINLGESVSHTFTIRNTGDYRNYSSQISLRITNLNPADADWIIDVPSTMLLPQGEETITASVFVRVPSTTHVGSSISFNVRAMVNLPKSVHGAETNPRYFDEIPGIVTSVNQKPVVSIMTPTGPSYPVYYYRETLEFEADARDPDGRDELLTYDWDFGDGSEVGPGNRVQKPTHSFAFPGTYQVSLTVVDEFGESNTALRTMKIGNRKPDVNAIRTVSGNTVFPKGPVTFIVDVTDEDPNSLDYTWYFGDGTVATISNEILITHTFTRTGPITVTCVAFDEFGGFGSNSLTITIQNNPPVPRFRVIYKDKSYDFDEETTIRITEGDEIAFDASRSSDPDSVHGDRIISYNWIFGDNTNGSGVQPTHIYRDTSRDGFMVSLTVTDSEGMQATITGKIQIEVKEKSDELSLEILALMAVLLAIVLILIIMFLRAPKRMAAIRGMAQTEMADLIKKLNALESKLAFGGAGAVAGSSFAPGPKKFCNTCGTSNEPDGKFCESCGTKLE